MYTRRPGKPSGFTLVELLVVIAIIAVLIGLLMPAVQQIRESANRTECASNLKQIGVALLKFHDIYRTFPTNGGPAPGQVDQIATMGGYWGLADPRARQRDQTGSWAYSILPYVEQANVVRTNAQSAAIPVYLCPTRGRQPALPVPATDPVFPFCDFTNKTGLNPWSTTDYAGNGYLLINRWPAGGVPVAGLPLASGDVKDGQSNTILVGEKAMDQRSYNTGSWYWAEPIFSGGSGGTDRWGTVIVPDGPDNAVATNWGSAHVGGAQFLFADGSVRPLLFGTDGNFLFALLTPAGGEVASPDQ